MRRIVSDRVGFRELPPEVVLTSYFTTRPDPQRTTTAGEQVSVSSDAYDYMHPWYMSMKEIGLPGVIFHDSLSEDFVRRYTTDRLHFVRVELGPYSTNDERFLLYYLYLSQMRHEKLFMTDISDVFVKHDPFPLITDTHTLWIGQDMPSTPTIASNQWAVQKANRLQREGKGAVQFDASFGDMPLMNAGVIGGSYPAVMRLLLELCAIFCHIDNANNHNMMALHYAVYRNQLPVQVGYPLTSGFKRYEINSDACLIHK